MCDTSKDVGTNENVFTPEVFMVSLNNCPSRVRLGALDRVTAPNCIEDLKDATLCHFEDLLHFHPFQWNDPSRSLLIPVSKEDMECSCF